MIQRRSGDSYWPRPVLFNKKDRNASQLECYGLAWTRLLTTSCRQETGESVERVVPGPGYIVKRLLVQHNGLQDLTLPTELSHSSSSPGNDQTRLTNHRSGGNDGERARCEGLCLLLFLSRPRLSYSPAGCGWSSGGSKPSLTVSQHPQHSQTVGRTPQSPPHTRPRWEWVEQDRRRDMMIIL